MTADLLEGLSHEEVREVYSRVSLVMSAPNVETAFKEAASSVRHEKRVRILEKAAALSLLQHWRVEISRIAPISFDLTKDDKFSDVSIDRRSFDNRSLLEAARAGTLTEDELGSVERAIEWQRRERAA